MVVKLYAWPETCPECGNCFYADKSTEEMTGEMLARFQDNKRCVQYLTAALIYYTGKLSEQEKNNMIRQVQGR